MVDATASKGEAKNSFFGDLLGAAKEGISSGLTEGFSTALPRWANKSFEDQSQDQLADTTFNAANAPRRIDQINPKFDDKNSTNAIGKMESMGIGTNTLVIGGVVLTMVFFGFVMSRK